jgi:hypothetical protein
MRHSEGRREALVGVRHGRQDLEVRWVVYIAIS